MAEEKMLQNDREDQEEKVQELVEQAQEEQLSEATNNETVDGVEEQPDALTEEDYNKVEGDAVPEQSVKEEASEEQQENALEQSVDVAEQEGSGAFKRMRDSWANGGF